MSQKRKFIPDCEDCVREKRKIKHLWVLVWPNGTLLSRNLGIPAAFNTKKQAQRFKFNSTYETPTIMRFEAREQENPHQ